MTNTDLIEFLQQPKPEFPTLTWKFAKTMASTPHSYTVRNGDNEDEYAKLFRRIGEQDVWEQWNGRRYRYLTIGAFRYWRMTNHMPSSRIINRAKA